MVDVQPDQCGSCAASFSSRDGENASASSTVDPVYQHPNVWLDALLRENVLLAVLPFLEAADAARFASSCTELQAALRAPRVQPLWREWFNASGFVWWPYGGVCGAACSRQVDRDGFLVENDQQHDQEPREDRLRPSTGYREFRHEGWCCQFLWNARAWHNWQSGNCAFSVLPTEGHKLFTVSVHPRGTYASRTEVARPHKSTPPQQRQHRNQGAQVSQDNLELDLSPTDGNVQPYIASPVSDCTTSQPAVVFAPGAGEALVDALRRKAVILTAGSDRVMCFLKPEGGAYPSAVRAPRPLVAASKGVGGGGVAGATGVCLRQTKDLGGLLLSPRTTYAAAGSFSSLESLELELESLISGGGSGRRGSGKSRRSGGSRQNGGPSPGDTRKTNGEASPALISASRGISCRTPPRNTAWSPPPAVLSFPCTATASAVSAAAEQPCLQGAASAEEDPVKAREVCMCWGRSCWHSCSVDAASGLMACSLSSEQSGNCRGRRKKGGASGGVADACEYRVFDLLSETEIAQLSIEGHLVHSLLLNFIFSRYGTRVFAFDRWHR
ncbi:hypothetical protein cyc_05912 [Cyclospora cayetanensis]|uniref:F-box domain-containing protein n=1 Tax=Cyclospora cayetanensis TaxID=88456 RepID=A0A1D3CWM2_9EIME|nr:hypothetical protein cyc_05912 [Cyclospora cayetanensis]